MNTVTVLCESCGKNVSKPLKEYNRSVKRSRRFFCNNSCGAHFYNKPKLSKRSAQCPECGTGFTSKRHKSKWTTYCSRSCASKSSQSVTPKRVATARAWGKRNSGNLISPSEGLKRREAWKYEGLKECLSGLEHEFEYELKGRVYDLFIPTLGLIVEFDGPYHKSSIQKEADHSKDATAHSLGYKVVRISTPQAEPIPPSSLDFLSYARQQLLAA